MGIDRFVRWGTAPKPTFAELRTTLEDYLGDALLSLRVDGPRIIALLVGKPSYPFRNQPDYAKYTAAVEQREERFLEVLVSDEDIDVITRQTDEYTNVVAQGFAELCRRRWRGKHVSTP